MQKKVLITGGSGFLGRGLARALERTHEVVLLSEDPGRRMPADGLARWAALSVDVTDVHALRSCFRDVRPDIVIHAAAVKSIEQAEARPLECVDVNVIGCENVARVSMETGCGLVVGISSNRAAPPTVDTYGLTKAIAERLFCSLNGKTDTRFVAVRLGNVAWSTGSMLPVWKRMLDDTGTIETTGPGMRRFFLALDDAVDLVIVSIDRIEEFQGRVLARRMKQAQVMDILLKFAEIYGGSWKQVDGRPADRPEEVLVGGLELPYCRTVTIAGAVHYVLGFNERAEQPLPEEVSTANTELLSEEEIVRLLTLAPGVPGAREHSQ